MAEVQSPEQRVVKVIKSNEKATTYHSSVANSLKTDVESMRKDINDLQAEKQDLQTQIKDQEDSKATRNLIQKLKVIISGKESIDSEKLRSIKGQLKDAVAKGKDREFYKSMRETDIDKKNKEAIHTSTVAEANRKNISKQKEGSQPWEERVVPITETKSLKDALKGQDTLAEQIKFYSEHHYSAEPKYTLPIEQVRDLRQKLVEYQTTKRNSPLNQINEKLHHSADEMRRLGSLSLGFGISDVQKASYERQRDEAKSDLEINQKKRNDLLVQAAKEAETNIISAMPFYEVAVKQAEENNTLVDIEQFKDGLLNGLNIVDHIEKYGRPLLKNNNSFKNITFGEAGSGYLNYRFNTRGNSPTTENQITHEIGYCAGAVIDSHADFLAQFLRRWLAETIPVSGGKSSEKKALGFNHFINQNLFQIERNGTGDLSEMEALNEAVKITSAIDRGLKAHGFNKESQQFLAGFSFGGNNPFAEVKIIKD